MEGAYLVSPAVDLRQVDVVNEDDKLLPIGRAECVTHALFYVAFDGFLELEGRGGAGEVEGPVQVNIRTGFLHVGFHHYLQNVLHQLCRDVVVSQELQFWRFPVLQ